VQLRRPLAAAGLPLFALAPGLAIGLSAAALALGACRPPAAAAADDEGNARGVKEREIPPVEACEVTRREMVRLLETTSKLESEREVDLYPRLPGIAVEVLAEEGDVVEAGDVLARLESRDEVLAVSDKEVALQTANDDQVLAELAVEEALATIDSMARAARQAEREYERDVRLTESANVANPISKQQLEQSLLARDDAQHAEEQAKIAHRRAKLEVVRSKTALARAEVALEIARENLRKKDLVAPFDGVIALRNIRVGDNVGTGEAAFVLTDTTNLRAVFARPQEELAMFSLLGSTNGEARLTITATAEAHPGEVFEGHVERISPTIDPDSGQFRVTARLASREGSSAKLLPGMLVRMHIVTDSHPDALVVPKRALRREGERRYVLQIVEGEDGEITVRRVDVDEGYENDELIEIVPREPGALDAGDSVVLVGNRDLADGDVVRIEEPAAEAPPAEAPSEEADDDEKVE